MPRNDERSAGAGRQDLVEEGAAIRRVAQWINDRSLLCMAVLLLLFTIHAYFSSCEKPLWFDELFSLVQAQANSWSRLRAGMQADGNPPLYSLLAHVCLRLFGVHPISLRLPALVAYDGSALLLFLYLRRRWNGLTGLVGASVLLAHPFAVYYATEARPYGLILFFSMLALLGWTLAIAPQRRPVSLAMVTVAIAGGILSHHLAILSVGLPVFAGELTRVLQRRRLDWPLLGAAAVGALAWAVTLPMIAETKGGLVARTKLNASSVTPALLYADYRRMADPLLYPFLLLGLLLVVSWFVLRSRNTQTVQPWRLTPELTSMFATGATLFAAWLLIRYTTHYWVAARYGIGTVIGVCLLCAYLGWLSGGGPEVVLLCILLPVIVPPHHRPEHAKPPEEACLYSLPADQDIVIAKALAYPQVWWYGDAALRPRLFFLQDFDYAGYAGINIADISLVEQKNLAPWGVGEYHAFVSSHRHFILVNDNSADEGLLAQHLQQDGWTLTDVYLPACVRQSLQVRTAELR